MKFFHVNFYDNSSFFSPRPDLFLFKRCVDDVLVKIQLNVTECSAVRRKRTEPTESNATDTCTRTCM